MRCHKPDLRTTPPAQSGRDAPASTAWVRDNALEVARNAMLQCLRGLNGCDVARMGLRLRYAAGAEALWYLRTDLRELLVGHIGEAGADDRLACLPVLFQTLLPRAPQPCRMPRRR